jgi:hypothetical protein
MSYDNCCGCCTHLSEKCDYRRKHYCREKNEDHYPTDPKCNSFCRAYSRSRSTIDNMCEDARKYNSNTSGCYLTTIMCKLLGQPDNNYSLNKLREFRDNVMKKEVKYFPLLMMYDQVGPIISQNLAEDPEGKDLAEAYFNKYITQAVKLIEEGKNKEAIRIYKAMTQVLADRYQIVIPFIDVNSEEVIPSELGHGRILKPSVNNE